MVFPAVFALVVGTAMIAQWTASYISKQIPEIVTEPIRITFHIFGEMVTAFSLIISGIGLLIQTVWAVPLFLMAMGMLFYTAIVSPGYFAQQGNWVWVVIFGVMIVVGIFTILTVLAAQRI
jgi:hypothetical protein